jgi:hypothetical protein
MRSLSTLLAATAFAGSVPLAAQRAAPYVPLHHWAMPYVEHLIARGALADPAPLTRPLRQDDLVRALDAADTMALNAAERRVVRDILTDLRRPPGDRPWLRVDGQVTAAGGSHARRDPLREAGPGHATAAGGLNVQLSLGSFTVVTHPCFDTRLKFDPDYFGKKDRFIAGRNAEAYVDARWRLGGIFFGSLDRNWGPGVLEGLLVSPSPYSYDHLALTVGTSRLQLQGLLTQLDDLDDATGTANHRYFVAHRLLYRPSGATTFALWEGEIVAGPARELEPAFANLLNLGLLVEYDQNTNVNSLLGFDFETRLRPTRLFAQFLLDDFQIDRKTQADSEPPSYALTAGVETNVRGISWTAFYTQVANLTYRTPNPAEIVERRFVGLGRNFSDYDQLTLRAGALVGPGVLLTPEATVLRQGQGDFRLPFPPVSGYDTTKTIFQGVVERTVRLALSANWDRGPWGWGLAGNGGVHFIHNAGHVTGATDTKWVGGIAVTYRFRREGSVP